MIVAVPLKPPVVAINVPQPMILTAEPELEELVSMHGYV